MKYDIEFDEKGIEEVLNRQKSEISYSEIFHSIFDFEVQLSLHLPKMAWNGLKIHFDLGAKKRVRKNVEDTIFIVERWRNRWYLVDVYKSERRKKVIAVSGLYMKQDELLEYAVKQLEGVQV